MEEIDLCWRLKNCGYKVMYCAQSAVYHVGGGTLNAENPFKTYLNFHNNLLLLQKNLPAGRSAWVIGLRFWLDFLALMRFLGEGKRKDAWAVSRAHQSFVRSLFTKQANPVCHSQTIMQQRKVLPNLKGLYMRSIVVQFFAKKKTRFTDLDQQDFRA
jgi:GT2 family glycosyltransferase